MKTIKLLLLSLIMTLSITSFSQVNNIDDVKVVDNTTTTVTDVNSSLHATELLVDKYSAKIESTIISLAESLKQPAEHVYMIMVKQQYVKGIVGLMILLMTIIFIFGSIKMGLRKDAWGDYEPKIRGIFCIIFGIMGFFFLVGLLIGEYPLDIIQGFINPEYGAIKEIANLFK